VEFRFQFAIKTIKFYDNFKAKCSALLAVAVVKNLVDNTWCNKRIYL